jgi:DNA-binding transcriptional LysR family regulator
MSLLDPELLRTFVAVADGGSLAHAASSVGRSPSAITAQMQRLEALVGEPLLEPVGRGRELTRAGQAFVGHARRVLAAHREAWLAVKGARADGHVRLAVTQDFADHDLPMLLRNFARSFARVILELRVGRSGELADAFACGEIDVLVSMRQGECVDEVGQIRSPMIWLIAKDGLLQDQSELPLALLDAPCGFRTSALAALDKAGRPYRITATSPSLSGLQAAVRAGLAITLRTHRSLAPDIVAAPDKFALPPVGLAEFSVRLRPGASLAAADLSALLSRDL